jgi:L-aspartate oxidase
MKAMAFKDKNMLPDNSTDTPHLIIGSGIAGLMLALKLSQTSKVILIAKSSLEENNTRYAQGGIASAARVEDSFEQHIEDTLKAGAGLSREPVVRTVIEGGPKAIAELIDFGVNFTRESSAAFDGPSPYHLTREGGHSQRRVFHTHDATGKELLSALTQKVREQNNITVFEYQIAIDLITTDKFAPDFSANYCLGAYVLDQESQHIYQIRSDHTYLCTGGHGKIYLYTSNPDSATGDGVAMAWRAGCKLANLEFMQFHPTCLYSPSPQAKNFLISEAVRGEGGVLKNTRGEAFVDRYHPLGSLAPRDIVARAIDFELKKSGENHVYLDVRQLGREKILELFPNIFETCLKLGIDMAADMIPVVPAAHYSCGGVMVDGVGQTTVKNLYALGEVACTGLHGANRLASNSLLEAVVFADLAASHVLSKVPVSVGKDIIIPPWNSGGTTPADELVVLSHAWDEIRRSMWHYVGIVRSEKRLERAYDRITALRHELDRYYWSYQVTKELIEVRNLAQVAWLTVRSAIARKESRGIHYNIDFPETDPAWEKRDTVIW